MASYASLAALFSAIASAIRAKTGQSAQIVANDFPDAIAAIPSGGGGSVELTPFRSNVWRGYIMGGSWVPVSSDGGDSNDFFHLTAGHRYLVGLGATVSNRFRVAAFTTDPYDATQTVSGQQVGTDKNNPIACEFKPEYVPSTNVVLVVFKGYDSTADSVHVYVLDLGTAS